MLSRISRTISFIPVLIFTGIFTGTLFSQTNKVARSSDLQPIRVMIRGVDYNFDPKQVIGTINHRKKTFSGRGMDRVVGFEGVMDVYIVDTFEDTWLDAVEERSIGDEARGIFRPRIIMAPRIDDVWFELKGKDLNSFTGMCSMKSIWDIYRTDRSGPIASIPLNTVLNRQLGANDYILAPLIAKAAEFIVSIDTLPAFLDKVESDYLDKTKGDIIHIKKPGNETSSASGNIVKHGIRAVVTITRKGSMGSGVLISPDGYIVTNYHVVKNADELKVMTNNEAGYTAELIKTNPDYDLALIKIDAAGLPFLPFGDSGPAGAGDNVYAIGTPVSGSLGQSVSGGIISGIRTLYKYKLIQTDVPINPGNSGGALINDQGRLIGITTWKISFDYSEGLGFCIPSNTVIEMLNLRFE